MRHLLLAAALFCPVAAEADWWQGVWSYDPAWCVNADRIGSVTPAPIAITHSDLLGYENSCAITFAGPLDQVGAVVLTLECQSEGETYREQRLIMREDDSAIWMWFGSGSPERFAKCP